MQLELKSLLILLAPRSEQPYFHIHYKNEETYIILKGYGYFQVDGNCFGNKRGSVIHSCGTCWY